MQKLLVHTTVILLALGLAGAAAAAQLRYAGTLASKLGATQLKYRGITSTGVATVNMSGGGGLLHTLRLPGSITGSKLNPVTDPDTTATIKTIGNIGTQMSGTLGDFQNPPLASNKLLFRGISRLCLFTTCSTGSIKLDIPLSRNDGQTGVGIGGLLTGNLGFGSLRVSIEAAPWTLGSGTAVNQTAKGNFKTVTAGGFIHEAASGTGGGGSTAVKSGVVQLISPMQVSTVGTGANNSLQSNFTFLTIRFIPEPGLLILLGAGLAGLGVLGRNCMRR
jgi:hypothetical protein